MLLSSIGKHVQLSKVTGGGESNFIFPASTIDDVLADENGTSLNKYLPTVTSDLSKNGSALSALENGVETISDDLMTALTNA